MSCNGDEYGDEYGDEAEMDGFGTSRSNIVSHERQDLQQLFRQAVRRDREAQKAKTAENAKMEADRFAAQKALEDARKREHDAAPKDPAAKDGKHPPKA